MSTQLRRSFNFFFALCIICCCGIRCSQKPEWVHFTSSANIWALTDDGENIWIGGSALTKVNKKTGEATIKRYRA